MESSRELGGSCTTKHAGLLPGVDAIFLSETLDTVRFFCHVGHTLLFKCILSLATKRSFPQKTLGAKILQHLLLVFLDTKSWQRHWDRCLDFHPRSCASNFESIPMRTWSEVLTTHRRTCGFMVARHLENDIRLLCFTQEQQWCIAQL